MNTNSNSDLFTVWIILPVAIFALSILAAGIWGGDIGPDAIRIAQPFVY